MKKKLVIFLGLAMMCTACGSGYEDDKMNGTEAAYPQAVYDYEEPAGYGDDLSYDYNDEYAYDSEPEGDEYAETTAAAAEGVSETADTGAAHNSTDSGDTAKLSREMLIYRGDLSIDTLDFKKSVDDFKALLNDKGGFIESESYTDNYSTDEYYVVEEISKHNVYNATVRVPSKEYDGIMNSASGLGDVRYRTSNASNVTQQYSTYQSQLEIYEAEYKRYLSLLEKATEDEYALQIENELFEIQIRIADLKSGISNIENDVAYSYIDITIKEVSRYEEEPVKTDTFMDRLKNTCKNSWNAFLGFLEDVLFWFIRNIYYIVIWCVILLVIYRIIRKRKKEAARQETGMDGQETKSPENRENTKE